MLALNASKTFRKPRSNQALLSGLIFCGHCGNKMRPKMGHSTKPDGSRSFNYLCETKEKSRQKNCAMKNAPGNLLDEMVCNEIKKLAEDDSVFLKQWRETKKALLAKGDTHFAELKSLKASLSEKEKQINNLLISLAESADSPAHAYIQERINSIHEEKIQLEKRIKELSEISENQSVMLEAELEFVPKMLASFSQSFDSMSVEEKRSALRLFIDKVVWNGETVDLYLMGSSDTSLSKVSEPLQWGSQN
ncbi:recombinase zinc beta ribbon domain-containing protein [[Clostridium] scindens]